MRQVHFQPGRAFCSIRNRPWGKYAHWFDRRNRTRSDAVLLSSACKALRKGEPTLDLTIANADAREMVANLEAGKREAQAVVFAKYIDQLKAAGCEAVALTSMGAHFCITQLEAISSLPVISAIPALEAHFSALKVAKVGVLGTRAVMQSKLYGVSGVDVVTVPDGEIQQAHEHYIAMAIGGEATADQRVFFEHAALRLVKEFGADALVLGGTDLFLAFDKPSYPYPVIDCALVHAEAIARAGMRSGLS